ncbi:MAG: class I SAM-dependent methyltransferase [Parcubacteria group bacterium]
MLTIDGERFLPWIPNASIAYEHLHRYLLAQRYVSGKRVLDLASGEGYGADLLAQQAQSVTGVDINPDAVHHAQSKYLANNLNFKLGSITQVPLPDQQLFDVITCFEALEHVKDHAALLTEVKRLLSPTGIFFVSTPNKLTYTDGPNRHNPFHLKELYFDEFRELLRGNFKQVVFLGQRLHGTSSIWNLSSNLRAIDEHFVEWGNEELIPTKPERRVPLYFLAVASNRPEPLKVTDSILTDVSDARFSQKQAELDKIKQHERDMQLGAKAMQEAQFNREQHLANIEGQLKTAQTALSQLSHEREQTRLLRQEVEHKNTQLLRQGKTLDKLYRSMPYRIYRGLKGVARTLP